MRIPVPVHILVVMCVVLAADAGRVAIAVDARRVKDLGVVL